MSEIKTHIIQARHFEFGRVHHHRDAEALYRKDSASNEYAVALGRLCMENVQFGLMKMRADTLARLRRATATSEPSCLRKLAVYIAYLSRGWNHESINLVRIADGEDGMGLGSNSIRDGRLKPHRPDWIKRHGSSHHLHQFLA